MKKLLIKASFLFIFLSLSPQKSHAQEIERIQTLKSWEFFFGATSPLGKAYPKKDTHYNLGLGYIWDIDQAFIESRFDHFNRFRAPAQHYSSVTLGGGYIIHDRDLAALFVAAHFGLGFGEANDTSVGGFHMGFDIGTLLLRNADINLDIRFRLFGNTGSIKEKHPLFAAFVMGIHL